MANVGDLNLGNDSNGASGSRSLKRMKYHRHTVIQIQELEEFFKGNQHPDEKARLELGRRLGLEPKQIKFWFQNRRTQMKTQMEREDNSSLRQDNDKLRQENIALREALRTSKCLNCSDPGILGGLTPREHQRLMLENAKLKDELTRLGILGEKYNGSNDSDPVNIGPNMCDLKVDTEGAGESAAADGDPVANDVSDAVSAMNSDENAKSFFINLGQVAVDELKRLSHLDSHVWLPSSGDGSSQSMNLFMYDQLFPPCIGKRPSGFLTDGTRATGIIIISSAALVEALMDESQWTEMFPWNVGKVSTLEVIKPGMGANNKDGAMYLMEAEFRILSSMVPAHRTKFIRLCQKCGEDGWAVVDVSVDTVPHVMNGTDTLSFRKLPSGCIVRDLPNGCSKVTWVEHIEYDESIVPELFQPLLRSGLAFGAQKWISNLQKQCELFAFILSPCGDNHHPLFPARGKKSFVQLAQRMTRSFCTGVWVTVHNWEVIQEGSNSKVMMRHGCGGDTGEPSGIILGATTTVWLPSSPETLFDFLQDAKKRVHWDVLFQDGQMHRVLRLPKSHDPGNNISLLQAKVPNTTENQNSGMVILQDTYHDEFLSIVAYTAVDAAAIMSVMHGTDSSPIIILPSGFSILPDCIPGSGRYSVKGSGSVLTVGFQILMTGDKVLTGESVRAVVSLLSRTLAGIQAGIE